MRGDYPERIERLIREYSAEAHERELHRELTKLDTSFAELRFGGNITQSFFTQPRKRAVPQ